MTSDGTVIASIPAGAATDGANLSAASTSTDNTVLYDATAPDVTINQAVGQADPTNTSPINFTVIFSEAVTDFDDAADVSLSGTAGATTINITGGPTTYNVAVSGMTGNGAVIASIPAGVATDLASKPNNASTSTDNTVTYDTTAAGSDDQQIERRWECGRSRSGLELDIDHVQRRGCWSHLYAGHDDPAR